MQAAPVWTGLHVTGKELEALREKIEQPVGAYLGWARGNPSDEDGKAREDLWLKEAVARQKEEERIKKAQEARDRAAKEAADAVERRRAKIARIKAKHSGSTDGEQGADVKVGIDEAEPSRGTPICPCEMKDPRKDEGTMIACDLCVSWFHAECVGLSGEQVERIDQYICPFCETDSIKTTYATLCRRQGCVAVTQPGSRYCCDECGLVTMAARLSKTSGEGMLDSVEGATLLRELKAVDMRTEDGKILDAFSQSVETQVRYIMEGVQALNERKEALLVRQRDLDKKQAALRLGTERSEYVNELYADLTRDLKGGRNAKNAPVAPCGFSEDNTPGDLQLEALSLVFHANGGSFKTEISVPWALEKGQMREVLPREYLEEKGLCVNAKRRCSRHRDWASLRSFTLQIAARDLDEEQHVLQGRRRVLRRWLADLADAVAFAQSYRNVDKALGLASDVAKIDSSLDSAQWRVPGLGSVSLKYGDAAKSEDVNGQGSRREAVLSRKNKTQRERTGRVKREAKPDVKGEDHEHVPKRQRPAVENVLTEMALQNPNMTAAKKRQLMELYSAYEGMRN